MPEIIRHPVGPEFCIGYAGLLFDCDGTLADTMDLHFRAWTKVLVPLGVRFEQERYFSLAGMPTRHILGLLAQEQGIPLDFDVLLPLKEKLFLEDVLEAEPVEPVVAIARHYQGGKPMGVVSGGIRHAVELTLARLGIDGWFGTVVTADDTPRGKPHPDPFRLAAERLRVDPAKCLAFEDADLGLESALAAGMDVVDVRGMVLRRD